MYNITHVFEIDGNKYALDFINKYFCLLDEKTYKELRNVLSRKTIDLESDSYILEKLFKSGYFISQKSEKKVPNYKYDELNVSFAPVHDCNFSCRYCYASGGKSTSNYKKSFDTEKIDELIEYIYRKRYGNYKKYKFDFVSGGEPLLNLNILEYFLEKVRIMDSCLNKKTTVLIVTNGTLLTPKIIKTLDKYDVYLGISIDGPELIHNRQRVYKNGNGTYIDVVNSVKMLREINATSKIKNAWAMSVITRETGSLIDLMENCINLGFRRMQMQLVRLPKEHSLCFRCEDIEDLKRNYSLLVDHILEHAEKGDLTRLKMIANDNDSFGKFISRLLLRKDIYYRCFAGKNKIAVTANGNIYPCDSFCGEKNFCIGNLDNSTTNIKVLELFKAAHVQNREKCKICWARQICGGDCYYNSYMLNKNIYDPDPMICEMNCFFIEQAIHLLIQLKRINKDYIEYLSKFLDY